MSEATTRLPCDLLIEAGWVVPVIPHGVVLSDHAIAIANGKIIAVMPRLQARQRFMSTRTISRPQSAIIPGLINAHTHNPMTLLRGVADDLALMPWLQDHIWPIEGAIMGPQYVADGCELAVAEMLRAGTTCCNDNYFFPDVQAATYQRLGFRAMIGLPIIEFPSAWGSGAAEYFDKALEIYDNWRSHPRLRFSFAPHAPYTVSNTSFERIALLAEQLDLLVHCHVHETAQEVHDSIKEHGKRPLARLDQIGLASARLIAVHMTQLTEAEIALCAQRGISIAHCPQSNLKLASGFCKIEALRRAGATIAIGTDGCASNNDLDMFDEMRSTALLAKAVAEDATAMNAAQTLHAATMGGAKALGIDELVGSIEVGKRADLACIDINELELMPMYDLISHLVYVATRHQVRDVWIDGDVKLLDRVLIDITVDALIEKTRRWQVQIAGIERSHGAVS